LWPATDNQHIMSEQNCKSLVPDETIMSKIYFIRGKQVMLDKDLAELYAVETKQLKRAVRRNMERFPEDFMFELTKKELENWRYQFGTSNKERMGLRVPPFVFTEHGVIMLASVLNSERAIKVNIQIIRIYNKMHEILWNHKEIIFKFEQMQKKLAKHDRSILAIFEFIKQLEKKKQNIYDQQNRNRIGFKSSENLDLLL